MTNHLPPGWAWAEFGEIADTQLGKMLSAKAKHGHRPRPHLRNQNVQWHHFDLSDVARMDFFDAETTKYELQLGDLLVCEGGEVGRCAVWFRPHSEMYFQKALHRVRPLQGVRVQWIEYFLRWSAETGRFGGHTSGSTISHLPQRDLRRLQVPVPPTSEQARIVAAIDEHFSRLDAAESSLRQALQRLAVLRSAVFIEAFHSHGDLPPDWRASTIGDVADVQLGRQRSPQHHTGAQMRPYLRSANVTWRGVSLNDVKRMNFDDADFKKYRLEPGDLLLNEASGSPNEVGKPALWDGEISDCCFQNTLLRLRPHGVVLDYLYWYCYGSALSGRFGEAGRGVNIRHLGKQGLAQFPIPVPPRHEQAMIAQRITAALEDAESLRHLLGEMIARAAALRRSVLAAAFAGRLVPQDRGDEPASTLLERIKASQTTQPNRQKVRA